MKCPMCRQAVSVLLPLYTRQEQEQNNNDHKTTFDNIKIYNIRFSGAPRPVNIKIFNILLKIYIYIYII